MKIVFTMVLYRTILEQMNMLRARKRGRPNRLDLHRRAMELSVTPGHLSRVLKGERSSAKLLIRLGKLIESETKKPKPMTYDS